MSSSERVERFARRNLPAGEELEFAAEVILSPHPVFSQMLHALTMGGPRPRSEDAMRHPSHGIAVLTDRRLFVLAHGRAVMDVPRGRVRAGERGGGPVVPWVDVRWGRDVVRTAFHWSRARRDRFADLVGAAGT